MHIEVHLIAAYIDKCKGASEGSYVLALPTCENAVCILLCTHISTCTNRYMKPLCVILGKYVMKVTFELKSHQKAKNGKKRRKGRWYQVKERKNRGKSVSEKQPASEVVID